VGIDLAVTGFDGVQGAIYSQPSLTTLDQPVYDIGRKLIHMVIAQISGTPIQESQIIIEPTLRIRASTEKRPVLIV
jgi:LacI family transcriptional regulator, repressor for deo operon, udp, cdd, tsx, nupC, and nupG